MHQAALHQMERGRELGAMGLAVQIMDKKIGILTSPGRWELEGCDGLGLHHGTTGTSAVV